MSTEGTIQMFRSDDGGATWLAPVNATPGGNTEDKQWHTVDNVAGPGNGNVYLVSRRFGSTAPGIYFFRSTDNGDTFGPAGGSLIVSGTQPVQGAFVTVGPDHSVYVFWLQGTTIQMRKSTDQGVTFAAPVTVASGLATTVNGDLVLTGLRQGPPLPPDSEVTDSRTLPSIQSMAISMSHSTTMHSVPTGPMFSWCSRLMEASHGVLKSE
jgi:hypothetical protein